MPSFPHVALALIVGASPLAAQITPTAAAATLPTRTFVQVHTRAGAQYYGRVLASTTDSLVLSAPNASGQRATAWTTIDTLWVQQGTASAPLGLAGAVTLGAFSGWLAHGFSRGDDGAACRGACVIRAGAAGAAVGLVIGAAFGQLFPAWRQTWPEVAPAADLQR